MQSRVPIPQQTVCAAMLALELYPAVSHLLTFDFYNNRLMRRLIGLARGQPTQSLPLCCGVPHQLLNIPASMSMWPPHEVWVSTGLLFGFCVSTHVDHQWGPRRQSPKGPHGPLLVPRCTMWANDRFGPAFGSPDLFGITRKWRSGREIL